MQMFRKTVRFLFTASLLCGPVYAETPRDPADYPLIIEVHVSRISHYSGSTVDDWMLDVTEGGKHYELIAQIKRGHPHPGTANEEGLLKIGKYKARRISRVDTDHQYLEFDRYELLLPNGESLMCILSAIYE